MSGHGGSTPPRRRLTEAWTRTRGMLVDVSPLRTNREFRWLYIGQLAGQVSRQLLVVAVPFQVFVETRSSLLVGAIGLVQIAPLVVFAIIGGAAADAMGRRRVLSGAYAVLAVTSAAFAFNSMGSVSVGAMFALMVVNAAASGIEAPTRTSMIPSLVPDDHLTSAFALNQTLSQASKVVIPALGGLAIAHAGIAATYWAATVANLVAVGALVPLGEHRPAGAQGRVRWRDVADGWRYLRSAPLLQQLMVIDLNAMVFGLPRALFPVLGLEVLEGSAATVGLLHAAPGAGALVGAVTTGWVVRVQRQGRVVVLSVLVWGLTIALFGLARSLALALVLLALAGAADVVSNVFRNALLQLAVPEGYRGRLTAFKTALSGGGPHLGDAESGAVAAATTPIFSVVSGGVASMVGTLLIASRGRELWNQDVRETSRARREEEARLVAPDGP